MKKHLIVGAAILASAGTAATAQLTSQVYESGLQSPVFITNAGDGSGRLFVIEQRGLIRIIDAFGDLQATPFLNIDPIVLSGGERGLLGLAFHPEYADNGRFFVNYTNNSGNTVVAEYTRSAADPNEADPGSARVLMTVNQPFSNHNGGWVGFGPDGYLYISLGDGGSANDPGDRASNLSQRLGKLLRIDVDDTDPGLPYAIPTDNPFANDGDPNTLAEIWAYGLRNPWRTAFDRETGDLWIADVGQNAREEINFQPAGDPGGNHYGWRCREGTGPTPGIPGCPTTNPLWVDPIHEYTHSLGCSITGGYVYRGCELGAAYQGMYFFSDYCTGPVWYLDPANSQNRTLAFDTSYNIVTFGEDEGGELYFANISNGTIYKLVLTTPDPSNCEADCPADLAEPFDTLNFFDLAAYLDLFNAGDDAADFAEPFGVLNFFDLAAYMDAFNAGCP